MAICRTEARRVGSGKWEVGSQNRLAPIRSLTLLGLPSYDGRSYSASSKERLSSLHVPFTGMCNNPYEPDGFGASDFRLMTSDWMRSIPTNPSSSKNIESLSCWRCPAGGPCIAVAFLAGAAGGAGADMREVAEKPVFLLKIDIAKKRRG